MWELNTPDRVKLIIGILASDETCLSLAVDTIAEKFGSIDIESDTWEFIQTDYYNNQMGQNILRKFVSIDRTISPGRLAKLKLKSNRIEKALAKQINGDFERPINLDPGIIEPSKLVLASTKNFSHRIYIGKKIWAEVTLTYDKGKWQTFRYTYPDYRQDKYFEFFDRVKSRLMEQLRSSR